MGAVDYNDFEELIIATVSVLQYEFVVGTDTFTLLQCLYGVFGCGVVVLAIKRLFTFYASPRR